MEDLLIPLLVPLGSFAMVVLILYFSLRSRTIRETKRLETIKFLIEKGEFDPAMLEKLGPLESEHHHKPPLYRGLVWLGTGTGITVGLYLIPKRDLHQLWAGGLILVFIGLAFIAYHYLTAERQGKKD